MPHGQLYQTTIDGASIATWNTDIAALVLQTYCYCEIWSGINYVAPSMGSLVIGSLEVIAGTVTIDRSNQIRRTASNVTMLKDTANVLMPIANGASGDYSPYGHELKIFKGFRTAGGGNLVAQLGSYLIEEVDVKEDASGVTLVGTLKDRSEWIARRKFYRPYTSTATTADVQIENLLTEILQATYLFIPFTFTTTTYLPSIGNFAIGDDPWKACCDIAASAGMQLYFDYAGTLILEPIPDQTTSATASTYTEGTSLAPTTLARAVSNNAVPNVICVIGQGSSITTPIQAWWWDSNPASKTYYAAAPAGGFTPTTPQTTLNAPDPAAVYPYLIEKFDTPLAASAAQAQAIAIAIGLTAIGSMEKATFTIRDNAAQDVDDILLMQRVKAGIPASTKYVVDHVQVALDSVTPMQISTRLVV